MGSLNPELSYLMFQLEVLTPELLVMSLKQIYFGGILASLPSILFAYDSFLGVGTMQSRIKSSNKANFLESRLLVFY